jgi:hypothetical protein
MDRITQERIARQVIDRLGLRRAREAATYHAPPTPNPTGFEGVDEVRAGAWRARIRFSDALSGEDTRVTLGTFPEAQEAGAAYALAHVRLWGSASRYSGLLCPEVLSFLLGR